MRKMDHIPAVLPLLRVSLATAVFCLVLCVPLSYMQAQSPDQLSTGSFRARRAYDRAVEAYRYYDHYTAVKELKRALSRDEAFLEAHLLLAEIYFHEGDFEKSIEPWKAAIAIDASYFPAAHYYLGKALLRTGQYEDAKTRLVKVIEMDQLRDHMMERSHTLLASAQFAARAVQEPVAFTPVNPGSAINSRH